MKDKADFTGLDIENTVDVRAEVEVEAVTISMVHEVKTFNHKAGSMYYSQEVIDIAMGVLARLVEYVQEHASSFGSYIETSARVWNSSYCLPESGHMNWPTTTKRRNAVENGSLLLALCIAAVLGCSLSHFWCREGDPNEPLMDRSKVYMKEGIIFINKEEQHCEEQKAEINSSRVDRKQSYDVKVKASHKDLAKNAPDTKGLDHPADVQKSDFWNALPFRDLSWVEIEYEMARGENYYAKVMVKLGQAVGENRDQNLGQRC
jgi:hypothetical protein